MFLHSFARKFGSCLNIKVLVLCLFFILGAVLRLAFLNRTDLIDDEAFYVTFAYKIAFFFLQNLWVFLLLLLAIFVLLFLLAWKRSLAFAVLFFIALPAGQFLLHLPSLTGGIAPGFIFFLSLAQAFTGLLLEPAIVGVLLSITASLLSGIVAFLLCKRLFNETAGLIAFALLMVSPLGVFSSTLALPNALGVFFMFSSFYLLVISVKDNSNYFPLAGVVLVLAFLTRYTALLLVPLFLFYLLIKRKIVFSKENRKNAVIFLLIVFAVLLMQSEFIIGRFSGFSTWTQGSPDSVWRVDRNDLIEAHYSSWLAESIGSVQRFYSPFFYFQLMNLFYSPILLALSILALAWAFIFPKRVEFKILGLVALGFFAFISVMTSNAIQRPQFFLKVEFALVVLIACFFGFLIEKFKDKRASIAVFGIATLLCGFFIFQSASIISMHDFKGFSEFVEKVPKDKVLFNAWVNPTYYYRGTYLYNTELTNSYLARFFPVDKQKLAEFRQQEALNPSSFKELNAEKVDFVIGEESFIRNPEIAEKLEAFKQCAPVKNGNFTVFYTFAKEECLN